MPIRFLGVTLDGQGLVREWHHHHHGTTEGIATNPMATRCGGFNPSKNAAAVMPNKNKELCSDRFTQGVCKGMCIENNEENLDGLGNQKFKMITFW